MGRQARRLPSGKSVLSGRPDPSELKPGAKLPPSIKEIDHLLKKSDEDPKQVHARRNLHLLTQHRLSSEKPTTSESKLKPGSIAIEAAEGQQKKADQQEPKCFHDDSDLHHSLTYDTGLRLEDFLPRNGNQAQELSLNRPKAYRRRPLKRIRSNLTITPSFTAH